MQRLVRFAVVSGLAVGTPLVVTKLLELRLETLLGVKGTVAIVLLAILSGMVVLPIEAMVKGLIEGGPRSRR